MRKMPLASAAVGALATFAGLVGFTGCAPSPAPQAPRSAAVAPVVAAVAVVAPPAAEVVTPAELVEESVELVRNAIVRARPRESAEKLGIVRRGARVAVRGEASGGEGCVGRWLELAPRGWVCDSAVVPTTAPLTAAAPTTLDELEDPSERLVAGTYGIVRGRSAMAYASAEDAAAGAGRALAGSNSVRASGVVMIDGVRFWRTSQGDLIDSKSIAQISPSRFKGVVLDEAAATLPAWVRARKDPRKPLVTRAEPSRRAAVTGSLPARSVVTVLERSADLAWVRVADLAWVPRADLRVATIAAPPPGVGETERWFDVDLEDQVLVAYEGARPVYATLVSTGKRKHATPTLIARVGSKLQTAHMTSDRPGEAYSVADVPWTMFYDKNYALHTSYWHDGFGGPRSHGCINLSPRDARLLYRWSSPDVPAGWIAVYGSPASPGSVIRVRSERNPAPAYRGYARSLFEAAGGGGGGGGQSASQTAAR